MIFSDTYEKKKKFISKLLAAQVTSYFNYNMCAITPAVLFYVETLCMIKFFLYSFSLLLSDGCHLVEKGCQRLSRLESLMIFFLT